MEMALCSCDESYLGAFKRREQLVLDERRRSRVLEVDREIDGVVRALAALPDDFQIKGNPYDTATPYVVFTVLTSKPLDYIHQVIEDAAGETVFIC